VKKVPKPAKIGKILKKCGNSYQTISVTYNNIRRLGNSRILTSNPAPAKRDFTSDF
jgi:hypothetical protein